MNDVTGALFLSAKLKRHCVAFCLVVAVLGMVSISNAQVAPTRAEAHNEPLPPDWCKNLPRAAYAGLERVNVPAADQWFQVYKVRPGVFAIYEPHQYEEVISYLITGSKRALLFDTGLGMADIKPVVQALTRLPIVVLNSHTHFDHIGDNWEFDEVWGVDSAYTRGNTQGATPAQLADAVVPERFCGGMPAGFKPQAYRIPPFRISHFVKDGEVVDLGGRRLEVLFTPGHTPDALSLLDRGNRLLFTGDSYYAGAIFLYVPETNLDDYRRTLDRLVKLVLQVDLVLPSHNTPDEKPGELLRLSKAFDSARAGKGKYEDSGDLREYQFEGFTILMKKQP